LPGCWPEKNQPLTRLLRQSAKAHRGPTGKTQKLGARLVIPEDDDWPAQLNDLARVNDEESVPNPPPLCLWVLVMPHWLACWSGRWLWLAPCKPTAYGIHVASGMGCGLAQESWTVVSEGAHGIDAAGHRGALSADGPNVVFLSGGVDYCYPPDHEPLFERIREKGLLVSEWPPGSKAFRVKFAKTRRLIAAATCAPSWWRPAPIAEPCTRSATRLRLERTAMAVPGPVTSVMSSGCLQIIRDHPQARLVTGAARLWKTSHSSGWCALPMEGRNDDNASKVVRRAGIVAQGWTVASTWPPVELLSSTAAGKCRARTTAWHPTLTSWWRSSAAALAPVCRCASPSPRLVVDAGRLADVGAAPMNGHNPPQRRIITMERAIKPGCGGRLPPTAASWR